jgi:hypothetical protein
VDQGGHRSGRSSGRGRPGDRGRRHRPVRRGTTKRSRLDERMALVKGMGLFEQLFAAMAQTDCTACGYDCEGYARAIADGEDKDLTKCAPGELETQRMLEKLVGREVRVIGLLSNSSPRSPGARQQLESRERPRKALAPPISCLSLQPQARVLAHESAGLRWGEPDRGVRIAVSRRRRSSPRRRTISSPRDWRLHLQLGGAPRGASAIARRPTESSARMMISPACSRRETRISHLEAFRVPCPDRTVNAGGSAGSARVAQEDFKDRLSAVASTSRITAHLASNSRWRLRHRGRVRLPHPERPWGAAECPDDGRKRGEGGGEEPAGESVHPPPAQESSCGLDPAPAIPDGSRSTTTCVRMWIAGANGSQVESTSFVSIASDLPK